MADLSKEMYGIQSEIDNLKAKKDPLISEKKDIELNLHKLTRLIRTSGRMPDSEYRGLCKRQENYRERIREIDNSLQEINKEMRVWCIYDNELRAKIALSMDMPKNNTEVYSDMHEKIKAIRNKYLDFAEDQTRINSMRVMASQFANELTQVLSSS